MILNPFYWIRLFLYTFLRIKTVVVLKKDKSSVGWYYVWNNGFYKYIYSIEHSETARLNDDFSLTNMSYDNKSTHFIEWKPLFTFLEKKTKTLNKPESQIMGNGRY